MGLTSVKESFFKVINFVHREFAYSQQVDSAGKYLPYGPNNSFPNRLIELVDGSPTATSCLSTVCDFIVGEGFNEGDDLENMKVNSQGMTFSQYHTIQGNSLGHFWGVATLVKFSATGKITQFWPVPFSYCRLGQPDDSGVISKIHYNPYFGTGLYKPQDTEVYDTWNPDQVVGQIARNPKFKGQIYWYGIRDRKDPMYPVPDYYSAHRWMNLEKNAAIYYDENLENGFLQSSILKMIGDPNDPSGLKTDSGEDIPKGKAFSQEMDKNFSGAKRNAKIMAFWASNKEEFPEIVSFPTNANADLYRAQDEHAVKKITIATKVPGILANISEGVSLGGDGNMLRAATKVMQQRVKFYQDILIGYYAEILSRLIVPITEPISIVPYNAFPELENVDPQVWAVLTPEEQRKWVKDHTEIELIETAVAPEETMEPVQNKVVNLAFSSYPKEARENAKRAKEYHEKMGGCLKKAGLTVTDQIINGQNLGVKEIRRLSRNLSKNTVHKDKPYNEACEALEYDAWGGSAMMQWANEKVKELSGKAD
jgi:hypothetical protein